jgi:hypothetical protein
MTTTLRIYRAASGQWSGRVLVDGIEVCAIAGCADALEVESAALEQYDIDAIETV